MADRTGLKLIDILALSGRIVIASSFLYEPRFTILTGSSYGQGFASALAAFMPRLSLNCGGRWGCGGCLDQHIIFLNTPLRKCLSVRVGFGV